MNGLPVSLTVADGSGEVSGDGSGEGSVVWFDHVVLWESRTFQLDLVGPSALFFTTGRCSTGSTGSTGKGSCAVHLDVTASALEAWGAWTVETVTVTCGHGSSIDYTAQPGHPDRFVPAATPGFLELLRWLVAREPAAPATVLHELTPDPAADLAADPPGVVTALAEQLSTSLRNEVTVIHAVAPARLTGAATDVITALARLLPARDVRFELAVQHGNPISDRMEKHR